MREPVVVPKNTRQEKKAAVVAALAVHGIRTGPGGKFDSTGSREQVAANRALVVKLVGQIGTGGYALLPMGDQYLLDDVRYKLQSPVTATFGWKQVERLVAIHAQVVKERKALPHA